MRICLRQETTGSRISKINKHRQVKNMTKDDLVWNLDNRLIIMEDIDRWKIALGADILNNNFFYKVKTPNGHYLDFKTTDINAAIAKVNEEKNKYSLYF